MASLRIVHVPSGELIAEGPVGLLGITSFEGNYYIARRYLKTTRFRANWIPGFCPYKGLYVWLDLVADDGSRDRMLGWRYWLPNPLFFFIAFRAAVPRDAPTIRVEAIPAR